MPTLAVASVTIAEKEVLLSQFLMEVGATAHVTSGIPAFRKDDFPADGFPTQAIMTSFMERV